MSKYSVFFVEDEATIREKIRDTIDWEASDFEYVGEAGDGEIALIKILECEPDIVVTDIKMPNMSGLELCKAIRNENLDTTIILISGFDDFSFAQEAIRLDVYEYLLKPVTPVVLMKTLNRAALTISKKKEEKGQILVLQSEVEDSLLFRRDRFFQRLMTGINTVDAFQQAKNLGIDLKYECFCIIVAKGKVGIDILELTGIIKETGLVANVFTIGHREVGILSMAKDPEKLNQQNAILIKSLKDSLLFIGNSIQLSVGKIVTSISNLNSSFFSACANIDRENNKIWNDFEKMRNYESLDIKALVDFMNTGSINDIDIFLENLFQMQEADKPCIAYSLYVISTISFVVRDFLESLGLESNTININQNLDFQSFQAVRTECKYILNEAISARNVLSDSKCDNTISTVCQKINEDFGNEDISLLSLAKFVSVSPSYLSTMFKRSVGVTLQSYLISVRIAKAKELLRTTNMRISEISGCVGYPNPNYFNIVFKRNVGINPLQYRKEK